MINLFKKSWLSVLLVLIFVSIGIIFFLLPKPELLQGIPFSKAVYDQEHRLLRITLSEDEQYRLYTPLSEVHPDLIKATLLAEDQYYYQHLGINPFSFLKAFWNTYVVHTRRIGASTISMQVARLRYHINSKTILGKCQQIIYALRLEMHYSKNQILESYLNLAPYGRNIQGIKAASLIYFHKNPSELTLPESLILSVIPQNPRHRVPDKKNFKVIRDRLFQKWVAKYPKDQKYEGMIHLPLQVNTERDIPFLAPHFVNEVLQNENIKEQEIITTLDLHLQKIVEKVSREYLIRKHYLGIQNCAILLIDSRDMAIKALLGSGDFYNKNIQGQINGTNIKRSPGSTLKPFIYGLALDQGLIHPATILKDVPHSFGFYNPENFDYDFMGPIKAKDALALSRNIPAIDLANQLQPNLYDLLQKAHINLKPESFYGLALALGGAELTAHELGTLYAMLANDGILYSLRKTENEVLNPGVRILSREASFLVLDMLQTKSGISIKTGTSSGFRDGWSIGVYGPYVMVVWLGNFNNKNNHALVGKTIATPLLLNLFHAMQNEMIKVIDKNKKIQTLNLIKIPVCKSSGLLPTRYCHDTELTWFIPGKSPIKTDTIYREVAIDKKTGLRTCHYNQDTIFAIYEFWPSDLLAIFQNARIERKKPPPYKPDCTGIIEDQSGFSPDIISPRNEMTYVLTSRTDHQIPLTVVTDGDVSQVYWFMNEAYLGKALRGQPFLWHAKPGKYVVRVIDDHGRADAKDFKVTLR